MSVDSDSDAAYEWLRWSTLADAVYEDWHGVWEPLWDPELFPESMAHDDRVALVERALRDLHGAGLIVLYRVPGFRGLVESSEDPACRLTDAEADESLSGSWWRGTGLLPETHPSTHFSPTPAGDAAVRSPPPRVRAVWAANGWTPDATPARLRGA